ncbi:MAG: hypothetical protein ACYDCL_09320 [Myxococcales bacterium]
MKSFVCRVAVLGLIGCSSQPGGATTTGACHGSGQLCVTSLDCCSTFLCQGGACVFQSGGTSSGGSGNDGGSFTGGSTGAGNGSTGGSGAGTSGAPCSVTCASLCLQSATAQGCAAQSGQGGSCTAQCEAASPNCLVLNCALGASSCQDLATCYQQSTCFPQFVTGGVQCPASCTDNLSLSLPGYTFCSVPCGTCPAVPMGQFPNGYPNGLVCVGGTCEIPCSTDNDCPAFMYCEQVSGVSGYFGYCFPN